MPHAFNINLLCQLPPKYPQLVTIRRELLLLKDQILDILGEFMVECVTLILVTRHDYIIHCIISIIPNVSVPHYFIDNSNYENVKLEFNARYVE